MNGVLNVSNVKEVKGFINGSDRYPNQYNSGRVVNHTNVAKALLISGNIDGENVSFFTPTVVVRETRGYLNFNSMKDNSWFELTKGEIKGARGHEMFDGGSTPNVAISQSSTIDVKIKIGDVLNISYKEKGEYKGTKTIKNVRVINK